MPFVELETGANLHYEHLNPDANGVPIVALHGFLGTSRKDLGNVLDWLESSGYQVYAPSLRGYGESTPKPRDFPFRFYNRDAKDILAFLEVLKLEDVHLLGYSDGGEASLICAGTQPERFVTVTTIGAIGYQGPDVRPVIMNYRPGNQWITPEEIELHDIPDPDAFSAQWVRSMVMLVDSGGDVAVSLAPKISAPLLMMLGKYDKLNPGHYAEHLLASGVRDGRLELFECGHAVHEKVWPEFQKSFLAHITSR